MPPASLRAGIRRARRVPRAGGPREQEFQIASSR
jgi:hypothetical protein